MVKVAIVYYRGFDGLGYLYNNLTQRGYKVKTMHSLSELIKPEEFEAILMHPGTRNQKTAIEFALKYPKIRTAIVTDVPEDYTKGSIPLFSSRSKKIIPFLEGKPLEDI